MNKFVVALTVLCVLLAPITAVQAQSGNDFRYISLHFAGDTVYVDAGDYIVLGHGWAACTRGFVDAYLTTVHTELSIDGGPIYSADRTDQYWGPIEFSADEEGAPQYCIAGNKKGMWSAHWDYPLGVLGIGEYEVYFNHWMDHPVLDGGDYDGDGHPDKPAVYNRERTFTIIVE